MVKWTMKKPSRWPPVVGGSVGVSIGGCVELDHHEVLFPLMLLAEKEGVLTRFIRTPSAADRKNMRAAQTASGGPATKNYRCAQKQVKWLEPLYRMPPTLPTITLVRRKIDDRPRSSSLAKYWASSPSGARITSLCLKTWMPSRACKQ